MNIYKISKGQLITTWIFGILSVIINIFFIVYQSEELDSVSHISVSMLSIVPFLIVFYTFGWKKHNKDTKKENIIYCNECGQKLSEDAKFCNKCGNKIK